MEFTHFGSEHLTWLAICVLLTCGTLFAARAGRKQCARTDSTQLDKTGTDRGAKVDRIQSDKTGTDRSAKDDRIPPDKAGPDRMTRIRRIVLFFVIGTHIWQNIFRIATHDFNIGTLPIHVCSLAVWACLIYELRPSRPLLAMLYCPFLPGAALAIIFPDWIMYPPFGILSITGFTAHVSIVIYILLALMAAKDTPERLRYRDLVYSIIFFACYGALILPFDLHFELNYGFLNWPSPGSPLEVIARYTGPDAAYRMGYAVFILTFVILWYLPYTKKRK